MNPDGDGGGAPSEYWVVVRADRSDVEVWSTKQRAEESIDAAGNPGAEGLYLYRVAASEMKRAFPNVTVSAGDADVDLTNKYIKKGWQPGKK